MRVKLILKELEKKVLKWVLHGSDTPSEVVQRNAMQSQNLRQVALEDSFESNGSIKRNPRMEKSPLSLEPNEVAAPKEPKITLSISEFVKLLRKKVAKK